MPNNTLLQLLVQPLFAFVSQFALVAVTNQSNLLLMLLMLQLISLCQQREFCLYHLLISSSL
jgi:hypothetical protein